MRSTLRFVAIIALVSFIGIGNTACSKVKNPNGPSDPPPPGTQPAWSDLLGPTNGPVLNATPNPTTTRSTVVLTTKLTVNTPGNVITAKDTYLLEYPDGHQVICRDDPEWTLKVTAYDYRGECTIASSDPTGTYVGILRHVEKGNGFEKKFPDLRTDPIQVMKPQ